MKPARLIVWCLRLAAVGGGLSIAAIARQGQGAPLHAAQDHGRAGSTCTSSAPTQQALDVLTHYEYRIPPALTAGKTRVVLKFQSQAEAATAAVFGIRIVPVK